MPEPNECSPVAGIVDTEGFQPSRRDWTKNVYWTDPG
jgi:hypothetical protein